MYSTGISILPAGSGPLYTNTPLRTPDFFSARYSAPNSRQLGPRSTGNRLEPLLPGYFSGTAPHVCPVFAASLHSGRASASWHRQCPDPPQHVAEQPPGQMTFRQQEPVVPCMLHQPAPSFTSRCWRLVSDQRLIRGGRTSLRHKLPRL